MKRTALTSVLLTAALLAITALGALGAPGSPPPNWDISGTWTGHSGLIGSLTWAFTMNLLQDGAGNVTGTIEYPGYPAAEGTIAGWVEGDTFVFTRTNNSGSYWATCDDCKITWTTAGAFSFAGEGRDPRAVGWQATGPASVLPAAVEDCTPASYEGYTLVGKRFLSAVGPYQTVHPESSTPVGSFAGLNPGMTYRVEASGTYFAGGAGLYDIRADAEYSEDAYQRAGSLPWTDKLRNYEGYGEGLLELKIDGQFVEWGAYNPNHVYTLDWTGSADPLTLQLQVSDFYPMNNVGGLCAALFYCQPSVVWLPPITLDDWTLNENATLPIKFQLKDCSNTILTTDVGPSLHVDRGPDPDDLTFNSDGYYYIAHFRPTQADDEPGEIHNATVQLDGVEIGDYYFTVVEAGKAHGKGKGNNP